MIDLTGVTMQGNFVGTNLTGTIIPITLGLVEDKRPPAQAEDGILVEHSTNVKVGTSTQGAP